MKFSKHLLILVFLLFYPVIANAEVLWEQNFNAAPEWSSTPSETQDVNGMSLTHADAISWWNASSYRVPKQKYDVGGTVMMEVKPSADRGGNGKGIIYWFNPKNDWQASSIDIAFNDPDIAWKNPVDPDGYTELWLTMWYKTPADMVWYNPADPSAPVGFQLWKACRFWAYDVAEYVNAFNSAKGTSYATNSTGHWQALLADNAVLSSHYLIGSTFYKKPFYIMTWYGQTMYNAPAYLRQTDADAGTSGFPSTHNRTDYSTHMAGGPNWFATGPDIPGFLSDNQWHKIEYHVKLNDLGQSNSIEEAYVDGVLQHGNSNGLVMRTTDRKFQQVILFDNHYFTYGQKTAIYIDDIIISTDRLPDGYTIGGKTLRLSPGLGRKASGTGRFIQ